ncbi:hypothetical protein [Enterococcus faecium]|uniref:hypothetical protein n=1 Tax=Enterococcus faecium TaxID=1352 RepID=UPI000A43DA88|nr:hypothetical protein [Enterococcus faecium]MBY3602892.1 hypothetical protein [Enterococcus faecium]
MKIKIERNQKEKSPKKKKERVVSVGKHRKMGSIIYGTDESELILQPHFYFRY